MLLATWTIRDHLRAPGKLTADHSEWSVKRTVVVARAGHPLPETAIVRPAPRGETRNAVFARLFRPKFPLSQLD